MSEINGSESYKNEKTKKNSLVSTLLGFTAGAVVGAVAALLYAPRSGVETREKIKEKVSNLGTAVGEFTTKTKEAFEEAKDKVSAVYEATKDKTSSVLEKAKDKFAKSDEHVDD